MTAGIEWDEQRGRYVNRGLEARQAVGRLSGEMTSACAFGRGGDLAEIVERALSETDMPVRDVCFALVDYAQNAAHNGYDEEERAGREVADLIAAWLTQTAVPR